MGCKTNTDRDCSTTRRFSGKASQAAVIRVGPRAQGTTRPATWAPHLKKPYERDNCDEVTDLGSFGSEELSV
jgi:hypothetical protein